VNLLIVSPTFHPDRGGAESLMDDLAGLLVERGHTVTIVTASGEPSTEPEKRRGARVLRVRYPHLPAGRQPLGALSSLIAAARMRRWYRRLLLGGAIDAVCIGRVEESCRYVLALRRVLRFRLTVYLHGAELRVLQRRWRRFRRALRWAIREADTVVAVSEELRGEAVGFAPAAAGKVRVIPNGVDVAAIRGQAPASWPRPYLLFAGRLERVKNAVFLIEAFAQAAAQVDPLDLVLAGSGSEERALTELVAARGLNGRVRFLGSVERDRVYALMKGALCLVVPSLAEGHPLVVLEAWAAGIPVLASDVKGLRPLVHDGVDGRLFPLHDRAELIRLIVRYAVDQSARATLRARVAGLDLRAYDIRQLVDRHVEAVGSSPKTLTRSDEGFET
jgi:glycosyltransferase involved in cell wall biosynthesis